MNPWGLFRLNILMVIGGALLGLMILALPAHLWDTYRMWQQSGRNQTQQSANID